LSDHFRLSIDNPIIEKGLSQMDTATRAAVLANFASSDPDQENTLPIIPLCGTALPEVVEPVRATITSARLNDVQNWIVDRLHAVTKPLLESVIGSGPENWAARSAVDTLISTWGKAKLKDVLQKELKDVIAG
jgi:hypothetical protein